jgi:hypothetical protein
MINTSPTIIESLPSISIKNLRENYLLHVEPGYREGVLKFQSTSRINPQHHSLSIAVSTQPQTSYVTFEYLYRSELLQYSLPLVRGNDPLGVGGLWYFLIPGTEIRCRKLFLVDGKFIDRGSIKNGLYFNQTQSRRWRKWNAYLKKTNKLIEVTNQAGKKYSKTHYRGATTQTELRIIGARLQLGTLIHPKLYPD